MGLKRVQKSSQIVDDIRRSIQAGQLREGDSLASVKSLCEQYRAGQRTIERALRALSDAGLIEVRPRSGCYVRTGASKLSEPAPAAGQPDATARRPAMDYLMPTRRSGQRLRVFLSEYDPADVAAWRDAVEGFDAAEIELRSFVDLGRDELFTSYVPDIVQGSHLFLESLGPGRFAPVNDMGPVAADWWEGVMPAVRHRARQENPLLGVPVLLATSYLFVNLELAERAGIAAAPDTPEALLDAVEAAQPRLANTGAEALVIPGFLDLLWMYGGFRIEPDGQITVAEERALRLFRRLFGSQLSFPAEQMIVEQFAAGRLLFLPHCSFEVPYLLSRASCRWQAAPLPVAEGVEPRSWLTVLGVHRQSSALDAAAALVRHLTGPAAQANLAQRHGHLPVRVDAHEHLPTDGPQLPAATVAATVERTRLGRSDRDHLRLGRHLSLHHDRADLLRGKTPPEELVRRLVWCAQLASTPEAMPAAGAAV